MRKLRRAHQRHVREQAKCRKKFKQRAVAAGTAAAITLGTGVCLNQALAAYTPDPHELLISQDADSDLLANTEEVAIGYHAFKGDQSHSGVPDGVELAKYCAEAINQLPVYDPCSPEPNEPYRADLIALGMEMCDICGLVLNMGGPVIFNPRLGSHWPAGPGDLWLPFMSVHYMEHGSFSFSADGFTRRVDVPQLLTVLELEYLYEPDDHHLAVIDDSDGDLLTDGEEATAGYDSNDLDQDNNWVRDGVELAKQCAEVIETLPVEGIDEIGEGELYKENHFQKGLEYCDICGEAVNMGFWLVKNPTLGLSIDVHEIACHYMGHGSFSYAGSVHNNGRIDVATLVQVLEMPRRCGDLGTAFLAGDLNDDCQVTLTDIGELTQHWLKDCSYFGTPYILGDLSDDCKVNLVDFAKFAAQWLNSTLPGQD